MNKIFKIALSLIICLTLLVVPMSVMAEEGIDYNINYETYLTKGSNVCPIDSTVPYSVFILYPTETGVYTITCEENIGLVSYLDMWVQFEPTEDNVNQKSITWTCNDVNQAIMIAIKSELSEVVVDVVCGSSVEEEEVDWIVYENTVDFDAISMPESVDTSTLNKVNFTDDIIDDVVLGDDGYYHLNDKTGPIVYINLNDSAMSLYTMVGYGKLSAIYYDEDGKVTKKVNYTDAFNEYVAQLPVDSADAITSYYFPLTADLIEMFKEIGATRDWYSGDSAWIYDSADAWMYACYYGTDSYVEEEVNNIGDVNTDGVISGKDAATLIQYVNGWDAEINNDFADVNVDGEINIKDYILLVRYISGWNVVLG